MSPGVSRAFLARRGLPAPSSLPLGWTFAPGWSGCLVACNRSGRGWRGDKEIEGRGDGLRARACARANRRLLSLSSSLRLGPFVCQLVRLFVARDASMSPNPVEPKGKERLCLVEEPPSSLAIAGLTLIPQPVSK